MLDTLSVRPHSRDQIRSGTLGRWVDDFVDMLILIFPNAIPIIHIPHPYLGADSGLPVNGRDVCVPLLSVLYFNGRKAIVK